MGVARKIAYGIAFGAFHTLVIYLTMVIVVPKILSSVGLPMPPIEFKELLPIVIVMLATSIASSALSGNPASLPLKAITRLLGIALFIYATGGGVIKGGISYMADSISYTLTVELDLRPLIALMTLLIIPITILDLVEAVYKRR